MGNGASSPCQNPFVRGNRLYHGDGSRLVIKGMNLECARYNDPYYYDWFARDYNVRDETACLIASEGFNAVRLNAGAEAYEAKPSLYAALVTMIGLYASRGIYSMPTCHDWTGGIPDIEKLKVFFCKVIGMARSAGYDNWLILNPWNEGGIYDYSVWTCNCKAFLDFTRTEKHFPGPIVFDQTTWAAELDALSADAVLAHDGTLRGDLPANVLFSNHWYPWTLERYNKYGAYCAEYPMLVGELGRWVDEREPNTGFAMDMIDRICSSDVRQGHNGMFLWIWHWSDFGSMTDDGSGDGTQLNEVWGRGSIDHMKLEATFGPHAPGPVAGGSITNSR